MQEERANIDKFQDEMSDLINKYSLENDSDTPDFLLAAYLRHCLESWNVITQLRTDWYTPPERKPVDQLNTSRSKE